MHIMVRKTVSVLIGHIMSELFILGSKAAQTSIVRGYPDISRRVFTKTSDNSSVHRVVKARMGKAFKLPGIRRKIIHPTVISPDPDSAFTVFYDRIDKTIG